MAHVFDELDAINNQPDLVKARNQRKAARREMFGDRLKKALGVDKRAADTWNIQDSDLDHSPIGDAHPGIAAVMYVREALGEYDIPSQLHLVYTGMKRKSGSGAHHLRDGVVFVNASFRSLSGVQHNVDVPVMVHDGHMVHPELLMHNGRPRVLAQSTFDDIVGGGEIFRPQQDRKNMYSAPPAIKDRDRGAEPVVSTGLYGLTAALRGYAKTAEHPDVAGPGELVELETALKEVQFQLYESPGQFDLLQIQNGLLARIRETKLQQSQQRAGHATDDRGKIAAHTGLDEAERDYSEYKRPGASVSLSNEVMIRDRGGAQYKLSAGKKGVVIRDMFGTGDVYYIAFDDGCKAPINKGDLK